MGPSVPADIISEILVSPPFQKYSTPMVISEKICSGQKSSNGGGWGGLMPIVNQSQDKLGDLFVTKYLTKFVTKFLTKFSESPN